MLTDFSNKSYDFLFKMAFLVQICQPQLSTSYCRLLFREVEDLLEKMPYRNAITICLYTHEGGPIKISHVTPCRPIRTVHLWGTLDYFTIKLT